MSNNNFIDGLYVGMPRDGAPTFIKGSISIQKEKFLAWISSQRANEKGYINLDILSKKDGTGWYAKVNDWTPGGGKTRVVETKEYPTIQIEESPF